MAHNVLILLDKEENETKSGIIIAGKEKEHKADRGLVVRVGDLVSEVKVDDRVIFRKWEGEEFEFRGQKFNLISEDNIIALYGETKDSSPAGQATA